MNRSNLTTFARGRCRCFASVVNADHRRELYSPASPSAGQLPDTTGPDGVRVTLRVEPAVDRLKRLRYLWSTPAVVTDPFGTYIDFRTFPGLIQKYVLQDRWAVVVEADNGARCRVNAASCEEAVRSATKIREGVVRDGVAYLRTLAAKSFGY